VALAQRTVDFYVGQIREPDLPLAGLRPDLVDRLRRRLKGDLEALPALDRLYGEIKSRANAQFPPISVGLILAGRDGDLLGGSAQVDGCFTRAAWDRFLRQAFQEAAQGRYQAVDWVLASPMEDTVDRTRAEENRERLEGARLEDGSRPDLVRLPMPSPVRFDGQRLPASYANFYICNAAVLVPTFNDPQDRHAQGILAELIPDRPVVGIHALDLVWGLGTLHCLSQQEPG